MITPRFELSQDDKFLTINVRAPYCCLRELEVDLDDNVFLFLCKPYYLRLQLPGDVLENENYSSSFDSAAGEFTFNYEKANHGEHFKDLELITKFLVTKVETAYDDGKIVVLKSSEDQPDKVDLSEGFGFALRSNKNFVSVSSEFSDVFEVDPCEVNLKERRKLRLQYEQGKFNVDHYMADYEDDGEIREIISQTTPWNDLVASSVKFTHKELDFLKDLPNVEYKLNDQQVNYVFNGLIDILYAYCYDKRTTNYEENSESGWNITKISATLCWLDVFETPKETLTTAFRRSVIYPLYRNFQLNLKILEDLKDILKLGEQFIIKCLIEIYHIFLGGDCCRYILNNLFVKDYIIYVMKWDKEKWEKYREQFEKVVIKKEDLGLNLSEIENGYSLDRKMMNLCITISDSDDDSSDESDGSSEDSDSSSDDDSSDTDLDVPNTNTEIFKFLC